MNDPETGAPDAGAGTRWSWVLLLIALAIVVIHLSLHGELLLRGLAVLRAVAGA